VGAEAVNAAQEGEAVRGVPEDRGAKGRQEGDRRRKIEGRQNSHSICF
jgi:hypothetical protein